MTSDKIKEPLHYTAWPIEPVKFIMGNELEFWRGNVIKYTMRAGLKHYDGMGTNESEITDLKKAIRYLEIRIEEIENDIKEYQPGCA
jgi:hypothetical protein